MKYQGRITHKVINNNGDPLGWYLSVVDTSWVGRDGLLSNKGWVILSQKIIHEHISQREKVNNILGTKHYDVYWTAKIHKNYVERQARVIRIEGSPIHELRTVSDRLITNNLGELDVLTLRSGVLEGFPLDLNMNDALKMLRSSSGFT